MNAAREEAIANVIAAWNDMGISPDHHRKMKALLYNQWPTLANSISALVTLEDPPPDNSPKSTRRLPASALFRGKLARVIGYDGGSFIIIDSQDIRRYVGRSQLIFIK